MNLPQDLRDCSMDQFGEYVRFLAAHNTTHQLRKRQEAIENQIRVAHTHLSQSGDPESRDRLERALANTQIMLDAHSAAIDLREFNDEDGWQAYAPVFLLRCLS